MSEIKINDERNMHHALELLNLYLEKKERSYFFKVVYNTDTLDLVLVKYLDVPAYRGLLKNTFIQ